MPVPKGVQRIDLAVTYGVPSFDDVFKVVDAEAKFQKVAIASEANEANPAFYQNLHEWVKLNGVM